MKRRRLAKPIPPTPIVSKPPPDDPPLAGVPTMNLLEDDRMWEFQ